MADSMADCDIIVRQMIDPEDRQRFGQDRDAMDRTFQFTQKTEHDVYPSIDPSKASELRQDGRVVLVTGAGRGIGRETALYFAKANAKAVIICAQTVTQLEETESEMHKVNPDVQVLVQRVDVTSDKDVRSVFAAAKEKFGMVDVLVSNAGRNNGTVYLADSDTDEWWRDYEVNVKGLYLAAKYFIQNLDGKIGTLISVSSTGSLAVIPTQTAYGPSKLGTNRIVEILHYENPNVRSFSVHPGLVDTEMSRIHVTEKYAWTMDTPGLAAGTFLFLTTPRADFLRGRWISANWPADELVDMKEQIVGQNLLKTGFKAILGPGGHKSQAELPVKN